MFKWIHLVQPPGFKLRKGFHPSTLWNDRALRQPLVELTYAQSVYPGYSMSVIPKAADY